MHKLALAASRGALVVKELIINRTGPLYLKLVARRAGIIAFLLSLLKIDATTTLIVQGNRIEFTQGSLSGQMKEMIPLSSVSNLGTGFFKPILLLVYAVVAFVLAIGCLCSDLRIVGLPLLLLAVVCVVAFFLKKTLVLFIIPGSSVGVTIAFKRSVIEGVNVGEAEARQIVELLTYLVEDRSATK